MGLQRVGHDWVTSTSPHHEAALVWLHIPLWTWTHWKWLASEEKRMASHKAGDYSRASAQAPLGVSLQAVVTECARPPGYEWNVRSGLIFLISYISRQNEFYRRCITVALWMGCLNWEIRTRDSRCIEHLVLCQVLKKWFLTGSGFVPQGASDNVWTHSWLSLLGCGVLPAPNRQTPGILLNILQCTEQPPQQKQYLAQNVNSAKAEALCSRVTYPGFRSWLYLFLIVWSWVSYLNSWLFICKTGLVTGPMS